MAWRPIASHATMVEGSKTVYVRHVGGRGVSHAHLKLFGFPPCPIENYGPVANVRQFTTLCCRVGYTGETNFRAQRNHREAVGVYFRVDPAASVVENSMLELATVFIAAFSASIFLAHAIEV